MNANLISSAFVLCFCVLLGQLNSSAIPMWEFLSKQEKMSFLYSLFANQVDSFCESSTLKNCNRQLLKYGLNTLKGMPEEVLDGMDPYQRGANNIIWESLMEGHSLAYTTPKPSGSTTTPKPNSYDDDEFFGDEYYGDFGSQTAASAKIDNVYRIPPPKGFIVQLESGSSQYATYPHNVAAFLNAFDGPVIDKGAYNRFQAQYYPTSTTEKVYDAPLTGPVVVKVYPDGTPVDEKMPVHHDEDLRQYKLAKVKIPNL
ncbi:hypothetical protein NQ314_002521 [Rhamnusium bicolor]|uniref:Uncharacterized protein n=1 Tax=Rhamnusium bicolor TaxID=1586634 RepID=A0AAV8ZQ99_9CUCU|nr:hypothetical protein NQ314_002521 [Rhamnusium bicolor]